MFNNIEYCQCRADFNYPKTFTLDPPDNNIKICSLCYKVVPYCIGTPILNVSGYFPNFFNIDISE